MSSISPVEPMEGYVPERHEERRDEINSVQDQAAEQLQTPEVKAEANKQDFKSTVQDFKYTGKGSFIDHVF